MARSKKLSSKEKYERQKELGKERQRRYREKMSEEKREEKRKYDRDRLAQLKKEGKVKRIADLTPRAQRDMRKYWRGRNKVRSLKKSALTEVADTPPESPASNVDAESSRKKLGRKIVRKDRAKAYRTIKKQQDKIVNLERKLEKYKKRLQRQREKTKNPSSPSPRKKVAEVVRGEKVSPNIKKELFLGYAFRKQIKEQVKEVSGSKIKNQILHKVVGNKILKKYRIQTHFKDIVPYATNKQLSENLPSTSFEYTRKSKRCVLQKLSQVLEDFFNDDQVSKMCPGKRDFVRKGTLKKQRRILLNTMTNLHKDFVKQHNVVISFASFCRARPFWVTQPKMADRDTCACIKHSNIELLISSLKRSNVIKEKDYREVLSNVVCSIDREDCMLSKCEICKEKNLNFSYEEDFSLSYFKWKTVSEERVIKNKKKVIKKTIKSKEVQKVSKIQIYLKSELDIFKKHVYYVKHQANELKQKLASLSENELFFRIDFSENYVAKFHNEVQSVHFGASKKQISLNTGVYYAKVDGKIKTTSFASASDNLDHQAHAIWAHMAPVFKQSSDQFPNTTSIHIFTDSPSNQYRNRINIHYFKHQLPKFFPNITTMTWNYTEAGHGKGPMDGVGGTLKREADKKVLAGTDITCAKDFVSTLNNFKILLFQISNEDIQNLKLTEESLKRIPPIPNIMQVHQITYTRHKMYARILSCFSCLPSQVCQHYALGEVGRVKDLPAKKKTHCKQRLSVDDVFTDTEDEEVQEIENEQPSSSQADLLNYYQCNKNRAEFPDKIISGVYVVVEFKINSGKKQKTRQFVGLCQGGLTNEEVEVMFLKPLIKDNNLFTYNHSDISFVPENQIIGILTAPSIVLKGKRMFYKFKKSV